MRFTMFFLGVLCAGFLHANDYKYYVKLEIQLQPKFAVNFGDEFDQEDAEDYGTYYKVKFADNKKIGKIKHFVNKRLYTYYKISYADQQSIVAIYDHEANLTDKIIYNEQNELVTGEVSPRHFLLAPPIWAQCAIYVKKDDLVLNSCLRLLLGNNFLMSRELVNDFDYGFAFSENLKDLDASRFLIVLYGSITSEDSRWFSHVMLQNCRQERRSDDWNVYYSEGDYAPLKGAIITKSGVVAICPTEQVKETIEMLEGKKQQCNEDLYDKMQKMFGKNLLSLLFTKDFIYIPQEEIDFQKMDYVHVSLSPLVENHYVAHVDIAFRSAASVDELQKKFNTSIQRMMGDIRESMPRMKTFDVKDTLTLLQQLEIKYSNYVFSVENKIDQHLLKGWTCVEDHNLPRFYFEYFRDLTVEKTIENSQQHFVNGEYKKVFEESYLWEFLEKKEYRKIYDEFWEKMDESSKKRFGYDKFETLDDLIVHKMLHDNFWIKEKRYRGALNGIGELYLKMQSTPYAQQIKNRYEELYKEAVAEQKNAKLYFYYQSFDEYVKDSLKWKKESKEKYSSLLAEVKKLEKQQRFHEAIDKTMFELYFSCPSLFERIEAVKYFYRLLEKRTAKYTDIK
ncbi:hypothetical protein [Candidatus Uabimicrobium amorphum]|uniref:Uncharacterized protein n=1 Tax=Uabimicrobium amorphum TaxID=2596890 RepID=A0A5S9F4F2_UABAM|nr:hypothetical protein [Candidatus Uabimicrobium amorphum]BBM85478.1 hypothetical protein UABAM_03847 [Candidatus Uabimicrobium amorphum]